MPALRTRSFVVPVEPLWLNISVIPLNELCSYGALGGPAPLANTMVAREYSVGSIAIRPLIYDE